jgi:hypothetical protein
VLRFKIELLPAKVMSRLGAENIELQPMSLKILMALFSAYMLSCGCIASKWSPMVCLKQYVRLQEVPTSICYEGLSIQSVFMEFSLISATYVLSACMHGYF